MSVFDTIFLNLCDAELKAEDGESFRVHRIILARKSEYFCSMFCWTNKNRRQFRIPGMSGHCLGEVLKYIYTGEVSDAEQNLDLMLAADYLCLADLRLKVMQYLMKNVTVTIANCLPLLSTAYDTNDEDIILRNLTFVERNFKEILLTQKDDFVKLTPEVLKNILGSRNLNVCSETAVWLSIVEWASKDVRTRSKYMPQLLMCLARNGLDENLAIEILQHGTVFEDIFMKYSPYFKSHLDALLHFLENRCSIEHPLPNRLPSRLHVISHGVGDEIDEYGTWHLYITYDETMDLWRKIGEFVGRYAMILILVGHNIYLIDEYLPKEWCRKFDIIKQQWMPMANFQNDYANSLEDVSTFGVDGFIYRIGTCRQSNCVSMQVYDTVNDTWVEGGTFCHIESVKAVPLNKKIYVVGSIADVDSVDSLDEYEMSHDNKMAASVFDTVTKRWEKLPPTAKVDRGDFDDFALLIYREKMYAIGGDRDVKNAVFDPQTNMWEEFPSVPYTLELVQAIVFDDQIIVYGSDPDTDTPTAYCWNRVEEKWKAFERSASIDFWRFRFLTVEDVDAIRSATKLSRDPEVQLEKSLFG